ncbi:MAG: SGNH/GDSL hydrolase family protein [Solirubrobacterales bacterium]|nr:SGNH/GDSL hydrolase family protein [Solirubrobacterales bacterium]
MAAAVAIGVSLALLEAASGASADRHGTPGADQGGFPTGHGARWVSSWTASPQAATPGSLAETGFDNQTVRNIVFTSAGGSVVRVRFTNAFGSQPLTIGRASIAVAGTGADLASGSVPVSFAGQPSVTLAPGGEALSDPVNLRVPALQDLAVSVYLPDKTGPATNHSDAQQVNYVASGDQTDASGGASFTGQTQSWYFIDSVDVIASRHDLGTLVALGDSITDGANSTVNANARWPNYLARRVDGAHGVTLGVADEGISGNRVLNDSSCLGVNAQARFDRDVLARAGAREVVLMEGINDIGFPHLMPDPSDPSHKVIGPTGTGFAVPISCFQPQTTVTAAQIIAGDEQLIDQAHAAGLRIYGATLTPFKGAPYYTDPGEATREAVNQWIRTSGAFDGVIDFDHALADPGDPLTMNPAYDSGDHLHPNDAGYRKMADTVSLTLLAQR